MRQLIDLCGVDYLLTARRMADAFSDQQRLQSRVSKREVIIPDADAKADDDPRRFAVVYHLLSVTNNNVRLRACSRRGNPPVVPSVVDVWPAANWYEREASICSAFCSRVTRTCAAS